MKMLSRRLFLTILLAGLVSCSDADVNGKTSPIDNNGDTGVDVTQNNATGTDPTDTTSVPDVVEPEDTVASVDTVVPPDTGDLDASDVQGDAEETDTTDSGNSDAGDDTTSNDATGPDTTDTGSDTTQDGGDNAPEILDFTVSPSRLSDSNQVIVSVSVTDPQGFADIGGGKIIDANGDVYAAFTGSGGSFSATLTWATIQNVARIDFADNEMRGFIAEFFDAANHRTQHAFDIELHCHGEAACDGVCGFSECTPGCGTQTGPDCDGDEGGDCEVDLCNSAGCIPEQHLENNDDNCGVCGNACGVNETCQDAACMCDSDSEICGGVCTNTTGDADNCGGCDVTCTGDEVCSNAQCLEPNYTGAFCAGDGAFTGCPGGECIDYLGSDANGFCNQPCGAADSCTGGYVCAASLPVGGSDGGDRACYKPCADDSDCGSREICGNPHDTWGFGPDRLICGVPMLFSNAL